MVMAHSENVDVFETHPNAIRFDCISAPSINDVNTESSCLCKDVSTTVSDFPLHQAVHFIFLQPVISQEQPWIQGGLALLPSWISLKQSVWSGWTVDRGHVQWSSPTLLLRSWWGISVMGNTRFSIRAEKNRTGMLRNLKKKIQSSRSGSHFCWIAEAALSEREESNCLNYLSCESVALSGPTPSKRNSGLPNFLQHAHASFPVTQGWFQSGNGTLWPREATN